MIPDSDRRRQIFEKTEGRCHICRRKLTWRNYGVVDAANGWEIEHSRPRAQGGTDRLHNLFPACIPCNRAKGTSGSRAARQKHGFKSAPLSAHRRMKNAWAGGAIGALVARLILAPLGPAGILIGAVAGAVIGKAYEPE